MFTRSENTQNNAYVRLEKVYTPLKPNYKVEEIEFQNGILPVLKNVAICFGGLVLGHVSIGVENIILKVSRTGKVSKSESFF